MTGRELAVLMVLTCACSTDDPEASAETSTSQATSTGRVSANATGSTESGSLVTSAAADSSGIMTDSGATVADDDAPDSTGELAEFEFGPPS